MLLDLEIVLHGDGPGLRWAQAARPGLAVEAIGPRGKIGLTPGAKRHLFAGDATAIPGTFAMMESLPAGVPARAYLMVGDPSERQPFAADGPTKNVAWHDESAEDPSNSLIAAVAAAGVPNDSGHAYLAGEVALVKALKAALLGRGWTADQISAKAYWNRGRANAGHGEPEVKA